MSRRQKYCVTYLLNRTLPFFTFGRGKALDHSLSEVKQVPSSGFNRQQNGDRQKVEHVVNRCTGKCTFQLVAVAHMAHGNDRVGDGSTDVGTHDNVDTLLDRNRSGTDQGHGDGRGGRRRLKKDRGQNTNHDTGNGVEVISKQCTSGTSSKDLGSTAEQFKRKEEEVEEEGGEADTDEDHGPLLRGMAAAGVADFTPSGIFDGILDVGIKIGITNVERAGTTAITTRDVLLGLDERSGVVFNISLKRNHDDFKRGEHKH